MAALYATVRGKIGAAPLGSLRSQLLRWLLIPLVLLVALNAVSVYDNALDAADLAYDRSLLASTRALAERVAIKDGKVVADVPYVALDSFETDTLGRIYYKVSGIDGETVSGFDDLPPVPANVPRSEAYPALVRFYHADYNGEPVRIAALLQPVYDDSMRGIALIQVGETLDARRGLSRKILVDTLLRQAVMVLAVASLVWFAVRLVLRPLMRLKIEVENRALNDLSDVDQALVHKEVRPLVAAMNGTMSRMHNLIASQRRFIADASHQLRTPLTVLKTQAELALRENDPAAMREIVRSIATTTDATVHLANRLLTLARVEHGSAGAGMAPVSLTAIVRQVGLEMALPAVQKQIDLSLDAADADKTLVAGHELMLHELVTNLVDNAIRYTPAGGKVALRVRVDGARVLLDVEDSGCGIADDEREKVLTPFYRSSGALETNPGGTGLGLSIVREVAAQHRADVTLTSASPGPGLKVVICFDSAA
ncbi:sensor histidine kinase N-terminal domain-containing protein [Massilia antarctica]|uniref:histidine kinase n=1 Tax=Massilia antarctica TaxID=2765360 RepID=A0AA48WKC2_9BURK|nr:sensor histidine kinase [Massilia antarctica]MCY0911655.1 sensor histidine kinase N-terminal domain-containing protein [Massilia sp. H27-R4]QPI53556.1 sensor histidine kinase N-terminal domain-containing protein [Massilia antarctica]CUI04720.1 Tricarboxylate transport sensor protein TctE [Janthinobacterium sp. CG23_2]CUU28506.1 Tricarboxylate transport sensor protein TctE [Janthinobacterium sp. CG23_2]